MKPISVNPDLMSQAAIHVMMLIVSENHVTPFAVIMSHNHVAWQRRVHLMTIQ